jgi:1,4-dihydroxy-2-naphthoate octaprenyltransferase
MTPKQKSVALGLLMALVGLALVLVALLMVLPVAVNLPDSWFGAVLAFGVMALGIGFMYHGGQRLWIKPN